VSVIDLSTGQVVATPNVTASPIAVTIPANQQSVYVTSGNNKTSVFSVISTATNQVVSSYCPMTPPLPRSDLASLSISMAAHWSSLEI
jgi:DNA-binding beta-propeller fold protein YncE